MHSHLLFDLLAWALALAAGYFVWRWRLKDFDPHSQTRWSPAYLTALAAGAVFGAFILGSANLWLTGQPGIGRSIAGALLGAIGAVEVMKRATGVKGGTGLYYAAPLAVGIMVGRIGCYSAGLEDFTYGVPWDGPFAVDFGDGVPRHPVQLYESAAMAAYLAVYIPALAIRWRPAIELGFYAFVAWYGAERFLLEFLKPYGTLAGPLNLFHFVSVALATYGVAMIILRLRENRILKG